MPEAATKEVVRPLRTIESEIKELIREADTAAEEAQQPFYKKIGPLLAEAREGYFAGDSAGFYDWATRKFGKSQTQIRTYAAYGARNQGKSFKHLEHFVRTPKEHGGMGHTPRIAPMRRDWTAPVDAVADRARKEAIRLAQEDALTRAQERDAERKLAHRLIDIGFKVLAKELHPDKLRGDRDAMARLNRVRDKLKHSI